MCEIADSHFFKKIKINMTAKLSKEMDKDKPISSVSTHQAKDGEVDAALSLSLIRMKAYVSKLSDVPDGVSPSLDFARQYIRDTEEIQRVLDSIFAMLEQSKNRTLHMIAMIDEHLNKPTTTK